MRERKLTSWLGGFIKATEGLESPLAFRQWAAVSAIACALERRVYTRIKTQVQYPNLYLLFVGRPGVGKSNAIKYAKKLLSRTKGLALAPQEISRQALYAEMAEILGRDGMTSPLACLMEEFQTFVQPGDFQFMTSLTDIYDNPPTYDYKTKHSGKDHLDNPCLNILGAITPAHMKNVFTNDVFEHGFAARIIMIHSDEVVKVPLALRVAGHQKLAVVDEHQLSEVGEMLVHDLDIIADMQGEFIWGLEAANAFEEWVEGGMRPAPEDTRLAHYNTRRIAHITKLCMIMSAARRSDYMIRFEDFDAARGLLLLAEKAMPNALERVGANSLANLQQIAWTFAVAEYNRTKKPVLGSRILAVVNADMPRGETPTFLKTMVMLGMLQEHGDMKIPFYVPCKKK